jgi:archaeosine-15-forming tRNA-guanine transglycosylase
MKLSFQPYKYLLKWTPDVVVASFLVQTVSGIREGNEVQVVDESDFNVYVSDATMSSS